MNKTLWKKGETKWMPRNKQAAFVVRKASENLLHTPPPEPASRALTRSELRDQELRDLRIKIEEAEQWKQDRKIRREKAKAEKAALKKQNPRLQRNLWVHKYAKRMAKSRGLPPPTKEEIMAMKKAQPNYGKPLWRKPGE